MSLRLDEHHGNGEAERAMAGDASFSEITWWLQADFLGPLKCRDYEIGTLAGVC